MYGNDEIMLTGKYKEFEAGLHYELGSATEKDVSGILSKISNDIEPFCFRFSGIDTGTLDKSIKSSGKGLEGFIRSIEENSSEFNKSARAIYDKKMMPIAETYYMSRLAELCGVRIKPEAKEKIAPKNEKPGDSIAFIGKYGKWVAIKKLGLEKVKDYEISGILSGINYTLVNKSFDFSGDNDESEVMKITKGRRKSYGAVAECLKESDGSAYSVCKILETVGYRPYASSHMLTDAYPDIKPPKVKGRKPKG